jgi:serine/threonine-protein phosphatase 2B regulatory subunit|uniref:EF-hand domain-containing protein n=1 Tax=Eutreptiella gymnastica TaxID=73025 RepID=A0A7S4C7L6_9EUGL
MQQSAKQASPEEIEKIKKNFSRHDDDNDGVISPPEFHMMLKRMGVLLTSSDEKRLFDAMDTDKNGKIEVGEFIAHYHTILALEKRAEEKLTESLKAKTMFSGEEIQAMYANYKRIACTEKDDGLIDRKEFRQMMVESDSSRNFVFYDALFRSFDRDGSGDIDFSEFVQALALFHGKAAGSQSQEERAKFFFGLYDSDGDGVISKQDLQKVLTEVLEANSVTISPNDAMKLVDNTLPGGKMDLAAFKKSRSS